MEGFRYLGFNIPVEKIDTIWLKHNIDIYEIRYNGKLFMKEIENKIFDVCERNISFNIIELWFDKKNKCFIMQIECYPYKWDNDIFDIRSFKLNGTDFEVLAIHKKEYKDKDEDMWEELDKDLETIGWLSNNTISIFTK